MTMPIRILSLVLFAASLAGASVRIKDLASIEGVRENQLLGYGLVVGLNGTGDRQQTVFSIQSLSNVLRRMGVNVDPIGLRINNIAAVMVTATLPPFATPGVKFDVTVSSIGDARSLQGGTLLLTALKAANGETYAAAQGPLSIGGFTAGRGGANVQVNHPTVGRVPQGALVEREAPSIRPDPNGFRLQLRQADFATASRMKDALLIEFPEAQIQAESSGTLRIAMPESYVDEPVAFLARLGAVEIETDRPARVTLNERTGTVVIGSQVRIAPVAILHGSLTVQIVTDFIVSQPTGFSAGQTTVVPQSTVQVNEEAANQGMIPAGATVEELVQALTAIGSTPRDIIAIMQSIAAAGALEAELQVM
jgi:flagellar P-ring protein precursor FlgI